MNICIVIAIFLSIDRNQCDSIKGDRYITEVIVDDPMVCRSEFCREQFNEKISSNVQQYSSLSLPFRLSNGTVILVSMILCRFGEFFQSLFSL